jgi:hypothetical protein
VAETRVFTIAVTYMDGTKELFEQTSEVDASMSATRTVQVTSGAALYLELEESLLAIPWSSVKHVEVSPALPSLPATVIRNVRRVSSG